MTEIKVIVIVIVLLIALDMIGGKISKANQVCVNTCIESPVSPTSPIFLPVILR